MQNESEKRAHERLAKPFEVKIKAFAFPLHAQRSYEVHSMDISEGGLLVHCSRRFEIGEKLQVTIFIPSLNKFHPGFFKVFESDTDQHLIAVAEVVRVESGGFGNDHALGLKFIDIYEDDWQALKNLILKELRKQRDAT
ncbi:PilZ domain-containing protein [Desulfonatronum thiosulfatophilum]|uniref:PilZ domain-containing protein n=1 Tax=Desulfonatronum thiosulfatophilum TaxID=617002 RepID=A0A1G6DEF3_9BACT|nr:PilZ domain-containing protein [Desulfonatronum thiosulfatophilum]SDB43501.1 PilZ domain-containing protein [Desulfonatronum thiosulfatophilum]